MSGERENDRRTKDALIRDMRRAGLSSDVAEKKAVKALTEMDRKLREKGER